MTKDEAIEAMSNVAQFLSNRLQDTEDNEKEPWACAIETRYRQRLEHDWCEAMNLLERLRNL